jgi:predicted nucleic acid-binding protein
LSVAYLDASAVVKLFKPEPESAALEATIGSATWMSSELVVVEALCTARRLGVQAVSAAQDALTRIELLPYSRAVRDRAGSAFSRSLTALDAIHAASALSVRDDLDGVYVYDTQLASALAAEGLVVASPGA